jgi:ABC-type lipoprotein release transport system permease subunit
VGQIEIVGVARDTKYSSVRDEIQPLTYTPWLQEMDHIGRVTFAVRVAGEPTALAPAVRDVVRDADPTLPVTGVTTQEAQARKTFAAERTLADLLTFFGALALLLAAIGLYGVMAYSVAQRTNEIGIRMALGAEAANVLRLIIGQGLKFAIVGLVAGALAALALERVVESQLYGVGAADPLTFAVVGVSLLAAALVACWVPARRATKVDPVTALRSE